MRIPRNHTKLFLGRNLRNSWDAPWENSKKANEEFQEREDSRKISWDIPRKQRGDSWKAMAAGKCLENIMEVSRKKYMGFLESACRQS